MAAVVRDDCRRQQLIAEARSRLQDAAARPRMPRRATALACVTSAALARHCGHPDEAREWLRRALDAYDTWMLEAHKHAERAIRADAKAKSSSTARHFAESALGPTGKFGITVGRVAKEKTVRKKVPAPWIVDDVNEQVEATHDFANEIGVSTSGRCRELVIVRRRGTKVASAELVWAP